MTLPFRLTREQMELRRLAAARDLAAGMREADVARKYGVSRASANRWNKSLRRKGPDGLRNLEIPGPEERLSPRQKERLRALLVRGAAACGYDTDLWFCRRVAHLIRREFGVHYTPDGARRLLHRMGFSHHKPRRQARERDEEARRKWVRETLPEIKKKPRQGPPSHTWTSRGSAPRPSWAKRGPL